MFSNACTSGRCNFWQLEFRQMNREAASLWPCLITFNLLSDSRKLLSPSNSNQASVDATLKHRNSTIEDRVTVRWFTYPSSRPEKERKRQVFLHRRGEIFFVPETPLTLTTKQ